MVIVHYRTKRNIPKVSYTDDRETDNRNAFCSNAASFSKIYKLPSNSKDLYLCIGEEMICGTCLHEIASVVELKGDTINFNYPAFIEHGENEDISSCFVLDARIGDIEKFEYNPVTKTLSFVYLTDDTTPILQQKNKKQKRITGNLLFNGRRFTRK